MGILFCFVLFFVFSLNTHSSTLEYRVRKEVHRVAIISDQHRRRTLGADAGYFVAGNSHTRAQ